MYVVYINLLYFLSIFLFTYNKNLLSPKKNQVCRVKWDNELSDFFNVSNGVQQGGLISPLLFIVAH